jgi:hypothetical protein
VKSAKPKVIERGYFGLCTFHFSLRTSHPSPGLARAVFLPWPSNPGREDTIGNAAQYTIRAVAAIGLALLAAPRAQAQDPAATPPSDSSAPVAPPKPDRWKFGVEFSYVDHSGNKTLRLMTAGLKLSRRAPGAPDIDGNLQSRYGKSSGEVVARNFFGTLSYSPPASAKWAPSFSLTAERDPIKRLDLRFSGGAGARYTPYRTQGTRNELSLSARLAYEFKNLRSAEIPGEAEYSHIARWNTGLKASREIRSGVIAEHQSSFDPAWGEIDDYILRSQTGLRILLSERLALLVEYQLDRNNRPAEGVEPSDRLMRTGITLNF